MRHITRYFPTAKFNWRNEETSLVWKTVFRMLFMYLFFSIIIRVLQFYDGSDHSVIMLKRSRDYTSICNISLKECDLVYFVNVYLLLDFPEAQERND